MTTGSTLLCIQKRIERKFKERLIQVKLTNGTKIRTTENRKKKIKKERKLTEDKNIG